MYSESYYTPEYPFTMRDAHRKPFQATGAPSIAWHLGFVTQARSVLFEDQRIRALEKLIVAIYLRLRAASPTRISNLREKCNDNSPSFELLTGSYRKDDGRYISRLSTYKSRYDTVIITSTWGGLPVWLRFELFEEYFTLTTTIDLAYAAVPSEEWGTHYTEVAQALDAVIETTNDRLQAFQKDRDAELPKMRHVDELCGPTETLYRGTWQHFFREILAPVLQDKHVCQDHIGSVFADFRGLILATQGSRNGYQISRRGTARDTSSLKYRIEGFPFSASGLRDSHWVDALLPILLAECNDSDRKPPFECTEYTFSRMANDRCLFGTGFGPQQSTRPSSHDGEPLSYLVLFAHDERRQIGRTVGRLHTLGTTRLAALIGLSNMMDNDANLAHIERRLKAFESGPDFREFTDDYDARVVELQNLSNDSLGRRPVAPEIIDELQKVGNDIRKFMEGFESGLPLARAVATTFLNAGNCKTLLREVCKILADEVVEKLELHPELKQRMESLAEDAYLLAQGEKEHVRLKMRALDRVRTQLEDMDKGIRDGISYRRTRSVYNRRIFMAMVRAMRIKRIEGFQPYHQFVEQRLLRSYSLLEAIAERHRVLTVREAELRGKWQTETAIRHQQAIRDFQSNAEQMLFLVLVPYYLIAALLHVWHDGEEALTTLQKSLFAWGGSLLFFLSLRMRKYLQGHKEKREGSD